MIIIFYHLESENGYFIYFQWQGITFELPLIVTEHFRIALYSLLRCMPFP